MGVERSVQKEGNGVDKPQKGDTVAIHYVGTLENGNIFDSSRDRGAPFQTDIGVGRVIKGWDEAVPQMTLGERSVLKISPDFAYGDRGFPNLIPPGSTLIFDIELLGINGKKA